MAGDEMFKGAPEGSFDVAAGKEDFGKGVSV